MRLLRDHVLVWMPVVLALVGTAAAQPSMRAPAVQAAPARLATDAAPVEVRQALVTPAGVSATLVNRSTQTIAGYYLGLTYSSDPEPQQFESITSNWGAQWHAGVEIPVLFPARPREEPPRVIVRAVVLADGTGYGDREMVARIRSDWHRRREGLTGALATLDPAAVPATEEELQGLVERVALEMARVPVGRAGESTLQPYVQVIAGLKRLQGRDMAGTERLAREMGQLAETLQRELAAVPGMAAPAAR